MKKFNPNTFYTQIEMASLPDGEYEIVEEREEIKIVGTSVKRYTSYKLKAI